MSEKKSMESLAPLIKTVVESGGEFRLITRGTSMLPLLRDGKDTAVLTAPPERLSKWDIPLYRRKDGSFVLHRAVKVYGDGERFDARGDNQNVRETGVPVSSVIAVMTAVIRDGKRRELGGFAGTAFYMGRLRVRRAAARALRGGGKLVRAAFRGKGKGESH